MGAERPVTAFVRALEELGYVLAAGDKRPYVLVDLYPTRRSLFNEGGQGGPAVGRPRVRTHIAASQIRVAASLSAAR